MQTLKIDDFRSGWIASQDPVRGTKNGLVRMDNLTLDEKGALTLVRGTRKVNSNPFSGSVHSIYSRHLQGTKYRYVGLSDGKVQRDGGSNGFPDTLITAGNGSGTRTAFGASLGYVLICSGTKKVKDKGLTQENLGVQAPTTALVTSSAATPELPIPDSYAVTAAEGSNVVTGADNFTADPDPATFRVDAFKTFASSFDTMDFGSDNFGTDLDFFVFNVRIPDLSKLVSIQLVLYFGTPDASPDASPDLTDYYACEWLNTNEQFIRDGVDQWSTLGGHRNKFERTGSDATKNWTNVEGFRIIATFSEAVEGFGFSNLRVIGGSKGPLTGRYEYRQVNVNNTGTYIAKSPFSPQQDHSTEVYHSAITVTPDISATDAQISESWIFRRKVDSLGSDPLARWLRCKVIDPYTATPFDDNVDDDLIQEINIAHSDFLISLQDALFPDDVSYLETNYFERAIYMSARDIWISEPFCPDLVDQRFTIRLSGDAFETNLWMYKVGPSTILVGTTNDIYEISGTLEEQPDGTIDVVVRGLGVKQPPVQDTACIAGNSLYYLGDTGLRQLSGASNDTFNGELQLLFSNHTRFGVLPMYKDVANRQNYYLASTRNKLWMQVTLSDTSRGLYVYDLIANYWYRYYTDPACLFVEEDGSLLAGYADGGDFNLREIDTLTGFDEDTVGQAMVLRTAILDDALPLNRKDSFTLKLKVDTGGENVSISIYEDESSTATLVEAAVNCNGISELDFDISGSIGVVKSYQIEITGENLFTFRLTEMAIEYAPRPKQTLYLRLPPENFGVEGRKRFPTLPLVIDTLGHDVVFTPVIDGVAQTPSTINTTDKQVFAHLFTSEKTGLTIGGFLQGDHLFEFYELIQPRPTAIEVLPDYQKYAHLPFTNLGTQSRKRFIAFAFVINTNGNNVTFTPIIDGVAGATSTVNKNGKLTHIHYFTADTVGTDIGGTLSGAAQFEFYGLNLEECISEKMPSPAKFLLIPQDDYGTPARKRFSSYKFRINTKGQSVTFTPRIDGVDKTASTFSTAEPTVYEHFFTDEDVIGINIGGRLSGDTEFEFYGPLRPRIVEELPDRLKYLVIPENNFGIAAKKRVRTLPMVINTNGHDVTFTPVVDGSAGTPTTFNTPSKRTVFHYFTNDSFGVDYKGVLDGDDPFEFYGMLKPEDVQEIPVGKLFDQLGPIEFPKIGKVLNFRIRLIPEGSSVTVTMFAEDVQIGSPITQACSANCDQVLEFKLPKGINATVFRLELSSASPFHRYYARFRVNKSGMDSEPSWILFGADPDAKLK